VRRVHLRRLVRLGTGALVLLVVHGFGAPRSAWASCGHPLSAQRNPFLDLYLLDEILMVGSSSFSHDGPPRSPLDPPARRSRCSGLSCSSRDPLPISTASPGLDSSQQWGAAAGTLVDPDIRSAAGRAFDEPSPTATGEKTSIFHPPRV
jgi:hypothetical protein